MVEFEEERVVAVKIPVTQEGFFDHKEITELFNYVFDNSVINKNYHPKNTFGSSFECSRFVFRFTVTMQLCDDKFYNERKSELADLVNDYKLAEAEYLRFRKFGGIESNMLIRRPRV